MITIYGNENCSWCDKAKKLATTFQLKFEYRNVSDSNIMSELKQRLPTAKTIPQIWWHDNHIGGYEQFASEIENTIGGNYGQGNP